MTQGGSSGDWRTTGTADAAPDSERLRQELRDPPRELVDWEASCLKNVADLLDSLDRARARWESLGDDLLQAQTRLERVTEERDLLAESHTDAQKAREELRDARQELEAIRRERDDVAASLVAAREQIEAHVAAQENGTAEAEEERDQLRRELQQQRDENGALAAKLETAESEKAEMERQKVEHGETEQELRRTLERREAELMEAKGRLVESDLAVEDAKEQREALEREVEELRAGNAPNSEIEQELARTKEQLGKVQRKLAEVAQEHESNLVQLFDLRTRATRLEEKLDDAEKHTRKKVRRIIEKIHTELDAIGAPRGDDLSYGERIRRMGEDG